MTGISRLIAALLFITAAGTSVADVRLPGMFSDAMVLQRDIKLPVWGWAEPGEEITVTIAGQKATATADKDGKWRVTLAPLKADGKPQELTVTGKNTIVIKDVLVGEVWLCGGQSNMQVGVNHVPNAEQEIASANFPQIRMYAWVQPPSAVPLKDHQGRRAVCSPQVVSTWTAVGFFFARHVHQQLGVPVGIMNMSLGSMPIQTFTSIQSLKPIPIVKDAMEAYEKRLQDRLDGKEVPAVKAEDNVLIKHLNEIPGSKAEQPETLYNSSIVPIAPYALRGALWYQGEKYTIPPGYCDYYAQALAALITEWRRVWGQGDFPFGVVQLPGFGKRQEDAIGDGWPEIREAQWKATQSVTNAGLVVTIDLGEADIHPKNKQDVGKRLAFWALANVYGKTDLVWRGPTYKSMQIEGDRIRITFDSNGGSSQINGSAPAGCAIAGKDKTFHVTQTKLDGNAVIVWSDKVKEPLAVRYAWAGNPVGNISNPSGLPAMPFRTDDWNMTEVRAADGERVTPATPN